MASVECQLAQGCVGDLIVIRGQGRRRARRSPCGSRPTSPSAPTSGRAGRTGGDAADLHRRASSGGRGTTRISRSCSTPAARTTWRAPSGEWTRVECVCEGDRIAVRVNGTAVNECRDVVPVGRQDPAPVGRVRAVRPQVRVAPARRSEEDPPMRPPTTRREFLKAAAVAGTLAALPERPRGRRRRAPGRPGRLRRPGHRGRHAGARGRPQRQARRHGRRLRGPARRRASSLLQGDAEGRPPRSTSAPDRRFVGFDAYEKLIACGRRRGPALHAAAVPAAPPPGGGRGRQARLRREAGGRRRPRRPLGPGDLRAGQGEGALGRLRPLPAVRQRLPRDRPAASTTARSARSSRCCANDYRGGRWAKPRQPGWTEMTYQMRNWYNFTWLSGDFNVEQHVHFLDVCAWVMKDRYPVKAIGMGGRQVLTGPGVRPDLRPLLRRLRVRRRRQARSATAGSSPAARTT